MLPEVPGPDGPRKLLLINHQASQSCAQPLSPPHVPRSRCVGPICPVSRAGSSSLGSLSVVPLPTQARGRGADSWELMRGLRASLLGTWGGLSAVGRGRGGQCLKLCPWGRYRYRGLLTQLPLPLDTQTSLFPKQVDTMSQGKCMLGTQNSQIPTSSFSNNPPKDQHPLDKPLPFHGPQFSYF